MSSARFFSLLAAVTAITVAGVAFGHQLLPIAYALPFSVFTVLLFVLLSVAIFFFGRRSAGAKNRHLFSSVFMGFTLFKMLFCGMLIVGYVIIGEPRDKLFILPFFWTYFTYTAFEVYFLMKLSATVAR